MAAKQNNAEAESLKAQIELDNGSHSENFPYGGEFLLFALERLINGGKNSEFLRELFGNRKKRPWELIYKTEDGESFYEKYKGYPRLFFFELCRNNYNLLGIDDEQKEIICEVFKNIINNELEQLMEEIRLWHNDNLEKNADLIMFIIKNIEFIKEYSPKLIEYAITVIWNKFSNAEKERFSYHAYNFLKLFEKQLESLTISIKNELEEYSDSFIMNNLNVESRRRKIILPDGKEEEDLQFGKFQYGYEFFQSAIDCKDQAVNGFVFRKIGYPLFIKEDASDEETISYMINVELNKNISHCDEEKIHTDTDIDYIWKLVCRQYSGSLGRNICEKVKRIFAGRDDLVEKIEKIPIRFSEQLGEKFTGLAKKLRLLQAIGTNKAFYKAWEIVYNIPEDADIKDVSEIIDTCAIIITDLCEHFPRKFIRKVVNTQNRICIMSICNSENEAAKRLLFTLCFSNNKLPKFDKSDMLRCFNNSYFSNLLQILLAPQDYWDGNKKEITYMDSYQIKNIIQLMNRSEDFCKKALYAFGKDLKEVTFLSNEYGYFNKENIPIYKKDLFLFLHANGNIDAGSLYNMSHANFIEIILEKPFFLPENSKVLIHACIEHLSYFKRIYNYEIPGTIEEQLRNCLEEIYELSKITNSNRSYVTRQDKISFPLTIGSIGYAEHLLSRTDDMFSTAIENFIYNEYKIFLAENRKRQISKLLEKGTLQREEADKFTAKAEDWDTDYYAWSNKEVLQISPNADLEKLRANLEPEFMAKIFEKAILWVLNHKESELWLNAPWFGMQIFNKSYADCPSIWAKHLIKIADNWNGNENMLFRICFALGHLREPLGGKVPITLQKISENQKTDYARNLISTQRNLFNRENFNKGHHRTPSKRVELCKEELIKGQNKEVL